MLNKVLVANRGEIGCRIIRTLKKMGITAVAVYSEADSSARHVIEADEAYCIGGALAQQSYLNGDRIIELARACNAEGIHPGYGFLSENQEFCRQCEKEGIRFIGPTAEQMQDFGLKHRARQLAQRFEVPLLPGSALLHSQKEAISEAERVGFPVMLKSSAGGGGIGMALCRSEADVAEAFERIKRLGENNFSDSSIFLEKFISKAKHIEVQVFGDGRGNALILGDRDCSVQRRNQKVIEETPAPRLKEDLRQKLHESARRLAEGVRYRSAGTVEFVYDCEEEKFYFLEVNTRLQVEHCVTEEVFAVDLVEWMVLLASEELPPLSNLDLRPQGAAIEVRLYAEDPGKEFQPSTGVLTEVRFPEDVRIDSWIDKGTEISSFYDPLLAKVIVSGNTREEAVERLERALSETAIAGLETNLDFLRQLQRHDRFIVGDYTTRFGDQIEYNVQTISVDMPGMQTTIQDYPGRVGYWSVGVPPSGPMDKLNHRLANRLVGNMEGAATLEITAKGPQLTVHAPCIIALTGADFNVSVDDEPVEMYAPVALKKGSIIRCGVAAAGQRGYLAVQGGFDVPLYMGSRSTFTLGQFGGHGGRALRAGDVLHIGQMVAGYPAVLAEQDRPQLTGNWEIGVLYGPHGAPEFFTPEDIETLFSTAYEVHYNSSRTGVRLIGPSPQWAREDGGEAGLHPSNIHDNAYAVGTLDFTGDMPVVLGPDGPSLGGFVCPVTIASAELWKVGQLRPGDRVRFRQISLEEAELLESEQEQFVATLLPPKREKVSLPQVTPLSDSAVVHRMWTEGEEIVFRRAGDKYLLVEFGEPVLDLRLRFKVHTLMLQLEKVNIPGVVELTPGIRSLQIHYDNRTITPAELIVLVEKTVSRAADSHNRKVESRIVYLPLSWDDEATHRAIEKYTQSVRPDAPWCPSNIEFIRRINGLEFIEDVKRIVFEARYLVMGLGDVYLGAPVATPLDPRHRLVTTKYNPARTWTPENAVGIGGAYLCVYGMEGPGGYQFVGRTIQMWNRYNETAEFVAGKPWLLRFFDQIRFYPVSHDELQQMRRDFPHGLAGVKIEKTVFDLDDYEKFLSENEESIRKFKELQQLAFEKERNDWKEKGLLNFHTDEPACEEKSMAEVIDGCDPIVSDVAGNLWKLQVSEEQHVDKGDTVAIIECMKMEFSLKAPCRGLVRQVLCREGDMVSPGQQLFGIEPA